MKKLRHPNVVLFMGFCSNQKVVFLRFESYDELMSLCFKDGRTHVYGV
jgi:hypothetical protein